MIQLLINKTEKKMTRKELINEIVNIFNNSKKFSLANWEINKLKRENKKKLQEMLRSVRETKMFTNNLD
tara:strand:- start:668 stop:874 length:207 start_codon:yes stop_codon:yes gene_type:complete